MRSKKRVLKVTATAVTLLLLALLGFRTYHDIVVMHMRFPIERRLTDSSGQMTFVPVGVQKFQPQKSMDEISWSFAVWSDSGLWINQLITSGDRDFAFGPFGRVFVLRGAGIDASEVESRSTWRGAPHDYPFPNTPEKAINPADQKANHVDPGS